MFKKLITKFVILVDCFFSFFLRDSKNLKQQEKEIKRQL